MNGAVPLLPRIPLWHEQGRLYIFTILHNKDACDSYRLPTSFGISESLALIWAG